MKRRNLLGPQRRFASGNRRRLLLKRVHQKVLLRRQQFQQADMFDNLSEAC